ncbi:cobalamin-binding protein [candidate division LCP-89 bacterium B3_LCP]|uniref:Cobalamin-binding protein n=1 Tax=candidate division LCP-89 bacterium B3_LCP TaxID=2012998 RepID=A0A532UW20_UNCL8|nr:MAG: cobalamin-binding protein [candidate division LCP-89 bacterium B3_LCP]
MHELYKQIADAVVAMQKDDVKRLAEQALNEGLPPEEAIEKGLAAGMTRVGELFASKEYFVPELLVCSRAMNAGFDILKSKVVEGKIISKGTVVIGVVDGDYHDIGKNIVKLMLEAAGFRLVDLGRNVTAQKFTSAVITEKPDIAALSTLMTTTMDSMADIVLALQRENSDVKIMVGGAPVNEDFAKSIDAHFYGDNAREAVIGAHELLGITI